MLIKKGVYPLIIYASFILHITNPSSILVRQRLDFPHFFFAGRKIIKTSVIKKLFFSILIFVFETLILSSFIFLENHHQHVHNNKNSDNAIRNSVHKHRQWWKTTIHIHHHSHHHVCCHSYSCSAHALYVHEEKETAKFQNYRSWNQELVQRVYTEWNRAVVGLLSCCSHIET